MGAYDGSQEGKRRQRASYFKQYDRARRGRKRERPYRYQPITVIGVDGEGFDHGSVYAYMSASKEDETLEEVENLSGLSTVECFEFLLSLPKDALKLGFSLGYDYTHILKDLSNEAIYLLNKPELRSTRFGTDPVWARLANVDGVENTYAVNLLSSRLSLARAVPGIHRKGCINPVCYGCQLGDRVVLWDCFKFFQSSFVKACTNWGVLSDQDKRELDAMKAGRAGFSRPNLQDSKSLAEWDRVKRYCRLETERMASLGKRLLEAHREADLLLKSYYGAGSTGAAMLEKMQARQYSHIAGPKGGYKRQEYPDALKHAIACAFFGGRFEISRRGPVVESCWSYDISSAYPYAFTFLPCLVHGKWELVSHPSEKQIAEASAALCHYQLHSPDNLLEREWGPFPFRNSEGNILFPVASGGGWVHKSEYLAASESWSNVTCSKAWIYKMECSCPVFRGTMPENYRLRASWGKEGKGIVTKLGMNSCYGKCAQSKGRNPPYQSFLWAGMTTASCRAQVLRAIALDPRSVLMIATDGIVTTSELDLGKPLDTGTGDLPKPLGGWEAKWLPNGIFLIRPGIAFPLGDMGVDETKARGIGKAILRDLRGEVLERWAKHGPEAFEVTRPMFWGFKSQVRKGNLGDYKRGNLYGRFSDQKVSVDYHPYPKRCGVTKGHKLVPWELDLETSGPYAPAFGGEAKVSEHVAMLRAERDLESEQADFAEEERDEL